MQEPPMHAHITHTRTHHAPTPTQTTTPPTRHTHTHTKMIQIRANCSNFMRNLYELRTKFVTTTFTEALWGRISHEIRTNFVQTSYEFRTTFAEKPHQHHLCMHRSPHTHTHFRIPALAMSFLARTKLCVLACIQGSTKQIVQYPMCATNSSDKTKWGTIRTNFVRIRTKFVRNSYQIRVNFVRICTNSQSRIPVNLA